MTEVQTGSSVVRVAAVGDVHCGRHPSGVLADLFRQMHPEADVVVLCGDLTESGLADEAREFCRDLFSVIDVPVIAVLGNHDLEAGQDDQIRQILLDHGVRLLDGTATEVRGIGFAGVKGFGGGFGRGAFADWGEPAMKHFFQESIDEAQKLSSALDALTVPDRIAVLHYAPIVGTVLGEPEELYPFLGSSRLEAPLNEHPISLVLHGHAHHGSPEGVTAKGVRVCNVAMPLLRRVSPERAFRVFDIATTSIGSGVQGD